MLLSPVCRLFSCEMASILKAGDVFDSFHAFEERLKAFQTANNVVFSRKSSKKLIHHPDTERLQYEFVHLECKQGKKRSTSSKGIRPNQRTLKCNCDAYIRVSTCDLGPGGRSVLKITGASHAHKNHPVDAMTAAVYPENRKVHVTETVKALASANVQRRNLKQFVQDSQGICVLPHDIGNLKRKLSSSMPDLSDSECVENVLENIRKDGGFTKFGVNENGEFEYVFFVSESMKRDMDLFSDVFVMDVTYKINRYLYPLVNVLCIDGEGGGRPVLHGFVRNESRVNLVSGLSFLKSVISECVCGPSVFFVDKDLSEIAAVHEIFPTSLVRLCSFHASTAVKRALTSQGLSSQQVDSCMSFFKEQRDTRSQERFHELCETIRRDLPNKTVQYFAKHWWSIADMWATHTALDIQTLHVTTANHVESYHSKIKKLLHPHTRLTDCIRTLLTYDSDLVRTKDFSIHLHKITHHYNVKHNDKVIDSISNSLTSFASRLVTEQYHLAKKITYTHSPAPSTSTETTVKYQVIGETRQQNSYTTTVTDCNCSFFSKFQLICRHIFSLKTFLGLPLYSSDMFADSRFLRTRPSFTGDNDGPNIHLPHDAEIVPYRRVTKTQEGRYRIMSAVTNRINAVYQMMGEEQFNFRVGQLEKFLALVSADKDFSIVDMTLDRTDADRDSSHGNVTGLISAETTGTASSDISDMPSAMTGTSSSSMPSDRTGTSSSDISDMPSAMTGTSSSDISDMPSAMTGTSSSDISDMPSAMTGTSSSDIIPDRTGPSSDGTMPDSFASVQLQKVKTRGRPRNTQNFTRQKKRKIDRTAETNSAHDIGPNNDFTDLTAALTDHTYETTNPLTDDTVTLLHLPQTVTIPNTVTVTVDLPHDLQDSMTLTTGHNSGDACIDESVCHKCGEEEIDHSLCVNGLMDWVRCRECPRWFHKHCLGSDVRVRRFVCSFCLPEVVVRMNEMLSDCLHNVSVMANS